MRILPELEAYRDRLTAKAAIWGDTAEVELRRELSQCLAQVSLLEKGVGEMQGRLETVSAQDEDRLSHRIAIQDQMRELTAAYAEALRRTLERGSDPASEGAAR